MKSSQNTSSEVSVKQCTSIRVQILMRTIISTMFIVCIKKTIKKFEYIHMNFKEVKNRYFIRVQPRLELLNSKFSSIFKNTKIYIIMFDDGRVYLGLTFVELKMRLKWHLSN